MRSFRMLLIVATTTLGFADTLYMKDGRTVAGTYLGGTARQVRMEVGNQVEAYDITDVSRIEFQSAAASAPSRRDVRQREVEPQDRVKLTRPDPSVGRAPAPAGPSTTIPPGTVLKVRMKLDG